jgi:hypothetical protein
MWLTVSCPVTDIFVMQHSDLPAGTDKNVMQHSDLPAGTDKNVMQHSDLPAGTDFPLRSGYRMLCGRGSERGCTVTFV